MAQRILFVCLGNICRSPAAEAATRTLAERRGMKLTLDSAGTAGWHTGKPPYGPMQQAAAASGIDMSDLRARQFAARDFLNFDLIIGMDHENIANINALRPANNITPVRLFTDFAPESGADHVPDPYYTRDFAGCLDLIIKASSGLLDSLCPADRP